MVGLGSFLVDWSQLKVLFVIVVVVFVSWLLHDILSGLVKMAYGMKM